MNSYSVAIDVKLLDSRCEFSLTLEKELPGAAGAKFTIEGFLESFQSLDRIEVRDSAVLSFDNRIEGLRGEATVSATVAASGFRASNCSARPRR